jgi:hypothetical protein
MMKAYSLLPDRFADGRHRSFKKGLSAIGYTVVEGWDGQGFDTDDLVLGWSAYGPTYSAMCAAEAMNARALVFEEAYIRQIAGQQYFAVGLGGHNGSGKLVAGDDSRWQGWGLQMDPWRSTPTDHVLVCGQRGFGYNSMAMPDEWPREVLSQLRRLTDKPLWFRPHPKRRSNERYGAYDKVLDYTAPLFDHLHSAAACVVWTSNCATTALLSGVPVVYCGPHIVTQRACTPMGEFAVRRVGDRERAFRDLSWAQWSVSELESGEAFRRVLSS